MAKRKEDTNPIIRLLYDGDPGKMGEVVGEEIVRRPDLIPSELYTDAYLDSKEFERAIYQHQHDANWLRAYYHGWRERFGDKVDVKVMIGKIQLAETKIKALAVYNQFLAERIKVEKQTVELESTIEIRDLQKQAARTIAEAEFAEVEARKKEAEARKERIEKDLKNQQEIAGLEYELKRRQLHKQIADMDKEEKEEKKIDPIEEHRKQAAEKTAKRIIDLEEEQKFKHAEMGSREERRRYREQRLQSERERLYPTNFENEGEWYKTLVEVLDDRADDVIEEYQKFKQRLDDGNR